jgi:putative addiction module component (TIGR02574 family)
MERKRGGVSNQDIEAAWSKEIERRVAEIDAGTVELVSWEEVRDELFDYPADALGRRGA